MQGNQSQGGSSSIAKGVTPIGLNVAVGPVKVSDVAEKIGKFFGGDRGREIGRDIDDHTKDVTISIP